MVVQTLGACQLMRLMRSERRPLETDWLLFGPTDPEVIEADADDAPPILLAAE